MGYNDEAAEVHRIFKTAQGEAETVGHPKMGTDHIFLGMLQEPLASTHVVLRFYEASVDYARTVVRINTDSWIFKKRRGKTRLLTATHELVRAREEAAVLACALNGSNAECEALHLLEVILVEANKARELRQPSNLLLLLIELKIDVRELLEQVTLTNRLVVSN